MGSKAAKPCRYPGCLGLVRGGTCSHCGKAPPAQGWQSDHVRGTRQERGYDEAWLRLRTAFVAQNPLCAKCQEEGRVGLTQHVHHKQKFKGLDDPLRLDSNNLEALCEHHHMQLEGQGKVA